jgi:hypothetical protein
MNYPGLQSTPITTAVLAAAIDFSSSAAAFEEGELLVWYGLGLKNINARFT